MRFTVRTNDQLLSHLSLWSALGMFLNWLYHHRSPSSYLRAGFQTLPNPVAAFGGRKEPQNTYLGQVIQGTRRKADDQVHWALPWWYSDPQPHKLHRLLGSSHRCWKLWKAKWCFHTCMISKVDLKDQNCIKWLQHSLYEKSTGAHLCTKDSLFACSSVAAQKFECPQWKGSFIAWFTASITVLILSWHN